MITRMTTPQGRTGAEPQSPAGSEERVTVLEFFASELVPVGPNMSNQSTPPSDTDFDDQ